MLTQAQVQRYSNESGLRDIMIAEKEVVLTFCEVSREIGVRDAFEHIGARFANIKYPMHGRKGALR